MFNFVYNLLYLIYVYICYMVNAVIKFSSVHKINNNTKKEEEKPWCNWPYQQVDYINIISFHTTVITNRGDSIKLKYIIGGVWTRCCYIYFKEGKFLSFVDHYYHLKQIRMELNEPTF